MVCLPKEQRNECIKIREKCLSADTGKGNQHTRIKVSSLESILNDTNEHLVSMMKTMQRKAGNTSDEDYSTSGIKDENNALKPPRYTQRDVKKQRK